MGDFFKHWAAASAAAGGIFLVIDMIWLRFAVPMYYRPVLGDALAAKFRATPAVIFYVLYFAAMGLFAVLPGFFSQGMPGTPLAGVPLAVLFGAAIGLVGYGTYNLTNLATLKVWTGQLALLDMAWGVVASALATGSAVLILLKLWT
ncbi:MAG TPA: DUF2177 family protein [Novosphingobium sp.]|nr:DUF2177 family protein [Novosphingobium sp.]